MTILVTSTYQEGQPLGLRSLPGPVGVPFCLKKSPSSQRHHLPYSIRAECAY